MKPSQVIRALKVPSVLLGATAAHAVAQAAGEDAAEIAVALGYTPRTIQQYLYLLKLKANNASSTPPSETPTP